MKKRILQFIGSFHQGGSERQAIELSRLLHQEGSFDVFAATLNSAGILKPNVERIGLPPIPEFPLTSFYNPNFVRQVRRGASFIKENRIDVVHAHDFYTNVFGMAAATIAGVKVRVVSKRETGGLRSGAQQFVENRAFAVADAVVVNSIAVRRFLADRGVPEQKLRLVYNGIEADSYSGQVAAFNSGLPLNAEARSIVMVANLRHPVKNVPMLLRVATRVSVSRPDVHFIIAGEGALERELAAAADQLGVRNNIHFIGRCTDIPALLASAYACVLTSSAEGFSNSILEYMAAGKPVVVTNVGGAAEVIDDGTNGYLVESDDDAAMAARLQELLDDQVQASKIGLAGQKVVRQRFSMAAMVDSTLGLYRSLLDQ